MKINYKIIFKLCIFNLISYKFLLIVFYPQGDIRTSITFIEQKFN